MKRLAILAVFLAAPAFALDPSFQITQYVQTVWRAPQTLPHDDVTAIVQTRDGYLWVGTVEGLVRFDGVRSVIFDKSNTPAFANRCSPNPSPSGGCSASRSGSRGVASGNGARRGQRPHVQMRRDLR